MTIANIFWGLVAGAGLIVAAIGALWAMLGANFTLPHAIAMILAGLVLTAFGACEIAE